MIITKKAKTKPIALLFKNKNKYLLDSSSNLITFDNNMKFKDLTEKQKKKLAEIYNSKEYSWDVKEEKLAKFTGKASRTARKWCEKLGLTNPKESKSPQFDSAEKKTFNNKAKRFIITWAQMNTPIHKQFIENIKV